MNERVVYPKVPSAHSRRQMLLELCLVEAKVCAEILYPAKMTTFGPHFYKLLQALSLRY
ncbi:MAG TPA: hypothetical protein VFT72_06885 [Opitutaceae bacterium]|nr:hypothetical protein [Opitutaceae bacterium]